MTTWSHSPDEVSVTWSHSPDEVSVTWSQSSGEVAASWYSLESVALGFIFWEGFDDINWEDITTSSLYPENWEDLG